MSQGNYRISVVIPAYNSEQYICRAIDSVLGQTYSAYEIIVVDDGSVDGTSNVVAKYGDKIRYICQDNAGPGAARNTGINAAEGNWIAFLDADDEYLPHRLEYQVKLLKQNPGIHWCAGNYKKILGENIENVSSDVNEDVEILVHSDYFAMTLAGKVSWTGAMLISKDILLETGGFRTDIKISEDTDLWYRIAYKYPAIGYVDNILSLYYIDTAGSLSRKRKDYGLEKDFVSSHIALAKANNAWGRFRPVAQKRIRDWIRGAKFDDRVYKIKDMLLEFGELFSTGYIFKTRLLILFPAITKSVFGLLSAINKKYNIRKKVIHPKD